MNKVKFFINVSAYALEDRINTFAEKHEILSVSIASTQFTDHYTAVVTYKE